MKFGIFENKYLVGAFGLGTLMQVIVVLVPSFAQVFKLVSLNRIQWLYTLSISVLPFVVVQLYKKLRELKFEKVIYMKYGKKYRV